MKTVCFIQSRLSSTRLPGKALMDIEGKPMIQRVYERIARENLDIFILVPLKDYEIYVRELRGVISSTRIIGGDADNVHKRFMNAIQFIEKKQQEFIEVIIRVTGDTPLLCPDILHETFQTFQSMERQGVTYVWNDTRLSYTDGLDVEVFCAKDFQGIPALMDEEQEHVTPAIRKKGIGSTIFSQEEWPKIKLSVDTKEDLERVRRVYQFCHGNPPRTEKGLLEMIKEMKLR